MEPLTILTPKALKPFETTTKSHPTRIWCGLRHHAQFPINKSDCIPLTSQTSEEPECTYIFGIFEFQPVSGLLSLENCTDWNPSESFVSNALGSGSIAKSSNYIPGGNFVPKYVRSDIGVCSTRSIWGFGPSWSTDVPHCLLQTTSIAEKQGVIEWYAVIAVIFQAVN
jgi:hypothetical protein